jgi:hypothetical protein
MFDKIATVLFWVVIPILIIWQWLKSRRIQKKLSSLPEREQRSFKKFAPFHNPLANAYAAPIKGSVLIIGVVSLTFLIALLWLSNRQ